MSDSDLRPYYNPDSFDAGYLVIYKPGIGLVNPHTGSSITSSIHPVVNNSATGRYNPGANIGIKAIGTNKDLDAFDKDYFNDLEFLEYFDFNNLSALLKNLFWNFLKNYCKVFLLQPLEITRLVLQVGKFDFQKKQRDPHPRLLEESTELTPVVSAGLSEESDTEINYFQPKSTSPEPSRPKSPAKRTRRKHKLHPVSKHTIDILSSIVAKDGPNALFRGLNAQFLHQTLSQTIEAWITGFLSPFLGIPDPFFLDLTHLTEPLRSLCLSVLACVLTGLVLMPLDLVKVRLMITQFSKPYRKDSDEDVDSQVPEIQSTRSIRESMRNYPLKWLLQPPFYVTCLTVLHQFFTSIFRKSAPYLLFIKCNVDQYLSPRLYTVSSLMLSIMEFFIKLPVENLLRKEQVRFLLQPKSLADDPLRVVTIDNPDQNLIVEFNDGLSHDASESNTLKNYAGKVSRIGLFDGWRVGVLNIIGFWGYKIVQSGATIQEERL